MVTSIDKSSVHIKLESNSSTTIKSSKQNNKKVVGRGRHGITPFNTHQKQVISLLSHSEDTYENPNSSLKSNSVTVPQKGNPDDKKCMVIKKKPYFIAK